MGSTSGPSSHDRSGDYRTDTHGGLPGCEDVCCRNSTVQLPPTIPSQTLIILSQVFYEVGISGFTYVLNIIVADTSSLKNRTLAFAFSNTPSLITTFIGPPIARAFYEKSSWRWGFALSSLLFFVLSMPILVLLRMNVRKAVKLGLLKKETNEEKWTLRNIRHNLWEYDGKIPGLTS